MTASGQFSRPPPGSYMAASGQFPVAAVKEASGFALTPWWTCGAIRRINPHDDQKDQRYRTMLGPRTE
jgi:hypothetical protein